MPDRSSYEIHPPENRNDDLPSISASILYRHRDRSISRERAATDEDQAVRRTDRSHRHAAFEHHRSAGRSPSDARLVPLDRQGRSVLADDEPRLDVVVDRRATG